MKKLNTHHDLSQLIPEDIFNRLAKKWMVDKNIRKLSTRKFVRILLQSFISRTHSLRELEGTFDVPKSTLGDAMAKRAAGFFEELFHEVAQRVLLESKDPKLNPLLKNLCAVDSTESRVHGQLLKFRGWRKSKNNCASFKLHTVWNVEGQWVEDFRVTCGSASDLTTGRGFKFSRGKIYIFDRAYVDLKLWRQIQIASADFVTRLKSSPRLRAVHAQNLTHEELAKDGVIADLVWFAGDDACHRMKVECRVIRFRHIIYRDPTSQKLFDFITSNQELPAQAIADIYKKRWSVELLYRWLKGHLHLRVTDLRSPNAVKIYAAMMMLFQLLLRLEKSLSGFSGTLWDFLRACRTELQRQALLQLGFWGEGPPNASPGTTLELGNA